MNINNKVKRIFIANFKLIIFIIPLVILGFGYLYLLQPKYNKIKVSGILTLGSLEQSLEAKENYLENLNKLKVSYNNLSDEEKDKLEQILPLKKDIPNLFVHFEKLVKAGGLELVSIKFIEKEFKEDEDIKILEISLSVKGGNYQTLKSFLSNLEKDIKIIDVKSIGFSENYNLKLETYYLTREQI